MSEVHRLHSWVRVTNSSAVASPSGIFGLRSGQSCWVTSTFRKAKTCSVSGSYELVLGIRGLQPQWYVQPQWTSQRLMERIEGSAPLFQGCEPMPFS